MSTFAEKINSSRPTLVDFHAVWCGPCKMLEPAIKEVHQKLGDKISFLKVDIDKNPKAARAFRIQGVPTLILFRNGEILWRESGVISAATLEQTLKRFI